MAGKEALLMFQLYQLGNQHNYQAVLLSSQSVMFYQNLGSTMVLITKISASHSMRKNIGIWREGKWISNNDDDNDDDGDDGGGIVIADSYTISTMCPVFIFYGLW